MPKIKSIKFKPIKPTDKKFQAGIYNYCDRWCEKCPDTDKCFLYAKEEQRKAEHIAKGEDINDPEIIWRDIEESFQEARRLLGMAMRKHGITQKDLEKMDSEEYKEPDFHSHPLVKKTTQYFEIARVFLDEFWFEQQRTLNQFALEVSLDDIKDEIETITWYHTMLPTKTWRLLYEIYTTEREEDKELKKMMEEDIPKFYALVNKCIRKSKQAINSLVNKRKELVYRDQQKKRIQKMLKILKEVEQGVAELNNIQ